ncbi:MAG: leucyl aminopeptidase [Betaproteobacteria bacterium]|nr:leucyl aminopeptidase [Betaproteobacteria bacterium]NBU49975.1 leucyl aminopeptidase [Betaproteobacteria bacterium]NBX96773.1 leucyl aminopeptidase [Betaproteobacteria bacterium]
MDFKSVALGAGGLAALSADALLLVVAGTSIPNDVDAVVAPVLRDAVKSGDLELKAGRTLYVHRPSGLKVQRLVLAVAADDSAKSFKTAAAAGLAALKGLGVVHLAVAQVGSSRLTESHAEALASAVADAVYVYRHTKPSAPGAPRLAKVSLACSKTDATTVTVGLRRGSAVASGVELARECANRPANHATPTFLAEQARALARQHGFKVQVLDLAAVKKLGMGSFMAVAQGSEEPLKFIVLQYEGAAKTQAPVVLVGKGITFDTGGISIKPAPEMDEMKFDMSGAASVLGAFKALGELKPRVNVVGLIPACENMPGGRAVKPGDVVKSMSGQTIEILNTDAEGRLILCDALTYAERFKPAAVIDIATLTGACVIALGHHHSGLFTPDDELAEDLLQAAKRSLDPAWRMPLDEEYADALKSNFADMGNVGGRAGGSITAAMFLKKFTARYRWAHLDIAGTAWKSGVHKGATGRPVPLLVHYVLSQAR